MNTLARHAGEAFNQWLSDELDGVARECRSALDGNMIALVLGGGYGRGEGGVVQKDGVERPYNDLDLTLVVRRKRDVPHERLAAISHQYEQRIGIDVDFSRPLTIDDVRHWPPTLMWQDLLNGHVVVAGAEDALTRNAPARLSAPLPLIEATRLMLNRGAGLLWALRVAREAEPPPDPDFIRRNFYKVGLALGDALLIAHRRHETPYTDRDRRFDRLAEDDPGVARLGLNERYRACLEFKFRPDERFADTVDKDDLCELAERWGEVWLHVERLRTKRDWASLDEYVLWEGLREPNQNAPQHWPRNFIQNRRLGRWSLRYPRERLYRELPILLGLTRLSVPDWPACGRAFLDVWDRFN